MNQIFKQLSKSRMILYLVLTPLSVWTSVASSLVLQPVLDAGLAKDLPAFVRASAWGLILAVLDFVVYYFACTCRQRILAGYIRALRVRYFSFLLRQRPGRFLEQDTAAHLSKLTAEAETVGDKYCGSLLSLYRALWSLALSVAAIVSARWELAIVVVVFSLLTLNLPKPFQKQSDAAEAACLAASEAHMAEAQESIRGFLLIRLHGLAAVRTARYAKAAGELEERETARKQKFYAVDALSGAIGSLSFVGIIVFAMGLVIQGKMSVGYVLSVSQLLGGVMLSFERLPGHLLSLRAGRALFRDSETAFREALEAGGSRKAALGPASRLEVRDLSFSYRPDRPLLSHVDLTLETGKKYALVGASGSGKSTLAKLLMGFLTPCAGAVLADGVPLEEIKKASLYGAVSYQSQNVVFFSDTIRNNILLGGTLPDRDWERIIRQARLEEMLSALPEGAEALIGENGRNISGGEAQRLGLARCLAHGAQFMVFDEVAASLDNRNAEEIEKTILSLPEAGVLMITHRVFAENMRRYDRIFVLKDGALVEQGTWEELTSQRGELYRLSLQAGNNEP